jgi:DHA1 family multidrug resistance protein-like MFS transporter
MANVLGRNGSARSETQPLLGSAQENHDPDLVQLNKPDNPMNPMNMATWRKWCSASLLGAMTFAATFASSVFNAAIPVTAHEFHVAPETMALATSLFVFGFAMGPVLMGPASELYGRKIPFFLGYLAFVILQVPLALAQDAKTVLVLRFLSGIASSGSPAIVGGYLADFLAPVERGVAVAIFAATTLIGPEVGAITGAIVVQSPLGWRWVAWLSFILSAVFSLIGFFVIPETSLPVLEKREAHRLRLETKNWAIHSRLEERPVSLRDFAVRYLTRPFVMLVQEPILLLMTLYISFVFGLVYLLFVVSHHPDLARRRKANTEFEGLPHKLRSRERIFPHCRDFTFDRSLHRHFVRCTIRVVLHTDGAAAKVRSERQTRA